MVVPTYGFSTLDLERQYRTAEGLFIGLDYDGTLVPITPCPQDARPTATVLSRLSQLARTPAVAVAVVSGRPLDEVRAFVPIPGIAYVGAHGLEIATPTGQTATLVPRGVVSLVMARLRQDAESLVAAKAGFFVESKRHTVALHYRLAHQEETDEVVAQFLACVRRYQLQRAAIEVVRGEMVVEVRPVGISKGKAVQFLLTHSPGGRLPFYIGHDVTDEEAFQIVNHLGGISILVTEHARPSAARYYLHDPEEVVRFLTRLLCVRTAPLKWSSLIVPRQLHFVRVRCRRQFPHDRVARRSVVTPSPPGAPRGSLEAGDGR